MLKLVDVTYYPVTLRVTTLGTYRHIWWEPHIDSLLFITLSDAYLSS